MRKKKFLPGFLVSLSLLLAACGGASGATGTSEQVSSSKEAGADTSLVDIQEAGVIRVGITGGFVPSNYHDEVSGDLVGYEADATRAIIEDLGVDVEFVEMSFSALLPALDSGRIDLVMHSMGKTEERAKGYNFTDPYFRSTYAVLVHDESGLETLEDLDGKRAAQSINTSTGVVAESLGATIVPIETVAEAVDLVVQQRADFYLADKTGTLHFLEKQPDKPVHLLEEEMAIPHEIGGVLLKGEDALTEALNESIHENTEDGTLSEIYLDYLGRDISVEEFR